MNSIIFNLKGLNKSIRIKALAMISVIVIFFGVAVISGSNNASASTDNQKYYICISINTGDTLTSIADTYITDEYSSRAEYIDEVIMINNLNTDVIYSGATLVVPYYSYPQS